MRGGPSDGGAGMEDRLTKEDKQIIADGADETRLLGTGAEANVSIPT